MGLPTEDQAPPVKDPLSPRERLDLAQEILKMVDEVRLSYASMIMGADKVDTSEALMILLRDNYDNATVEVVEAIWSLATN